MSVFFSQLVIFRDGTGGTMFHGDPKETEAWEFFMTF